MLYTLNKIKDYYLKGMDDSVVLSNCVDLFNTDAAILLWKLNDSKEPEQAPVFQEDEDAQLNKESWSVVKTLRYTNHKFTFNPINFECFHDNFYHLSLILKTFGLCSD